MATVYREAVEVHSVSSGGKHFHKMEVPIDLLTPQLPEKPVPQWEAKEEQARLDAKRDIGLRSNNPAMVPWYLLYGAVIESRTSFGRNLPQ